MSPETALARYSEEHAELARADHEKAVREHREELRQMNDREWNFVDRELEILPAGRAPGVNALAYALLAGRPLLPFVDDLFAGSVAAAVSWQGGGSLEDLRWLLRLAPFDWEQVADALLRWTDRFPVASASANFRWAVQYVLTSTGDPEQARRADEMWSLLHDG